MKIPIKVTAMRLLLMFDLPNNDKNENREYTLFRKSLLKNGYMMMQYSVYIKIINSQTQIDREFKKISEYLPSDGNIRVIKITEAQYKSMKILLGKKNVNEIYNTIERYVKI